MKINFLSITIKAFLVALLLMFTVIGAARDFWLHIR